MIHIDLFSGIGGFAYALDQVYGKEKINHIFCDNDEFCKTVLKKHWPEAPIYSDIRSLTANAEHKRKLQSEGRKQEKRRWYCDIVTGGFPCQPFSQAGRRRGTADDRYLWPEMFRVIRDFKPTWVIAENVRGLVTWNEGMVLETVCADLEREGYKVQPLIIPAVSVDAPHRRDRVWIIANRTSGRSRLGEQKRDPLGEPQAETRNDNRDAPDTRRKRWLTRTNENLQPKGKKSEYANGGVGGWERNWFEVATSLCRVDDGVPRRMDRSPRLKALGNAIVPQVAIEIIKAIKLCRA